MVARSVARTQILCRIPRRRNLLAYLSSISTPTGSAQPGTRQAWTVLNGVRRRRILLSFLSSSKPQYGLYKRLRRPYVLRQGEPFFYRRDKVNLLLAQSLIPVVPPPPVPPPVPPVIVLGPNSPQVVFASIDYMATVISQYANWP